MVLLSYPILSYKLKLSKTNKFHLISHLSKFSQTSFLPKKKWRFLLYHILIKEQQDRLGSYKCYQLKQANVPDTFMFQCKMCVMTHQRLTKLVLPKYQINCLYFNETLY